ncbi:MAG: hypothetical protein H6842_01905 [Rhodospirillaceae bacterium]|nr:hypothetical protein [Rhodospirillaceae bacterium]
MRTARRSPLWGHNRRLAAGGACLLVLMAAGPMAAGVAGAEEPNHPARVVHGADVQPGWSAGASAPSAPPVGHCRARVLLDCAGLDTVQDLETIGRPSRLAEQESAPEHAAAPEAGHPAREEPPAGDDGRTLRQLVDLSGAAPSAAPPPAEAVAPAAGMPRPPTTEEQLAALREAITAAGFGDQLEAGSGPAGDTLVLVRPAP